MNETELLAPGGSFDSAMAALENGADAVYCGLRNFSARKAAKNLSPDQLSRLRKFTLDRNKKVYLTLNTILKEEEIPSVLDTLIQAEELSVDGLIVQDPGLIKIVRDHFPSLNLHASTQMAVHNSWGLQVLKDMGFTRAVLPRELTVREIEELHRQHPDMELEVFIHGAQCYSFSGMCLASGLLLGRSGNRGDCGQICRTWFHHPEGQGYYFSCNDLYSGPDVLKIAAAGVSSLKIEGRMKSPAYAAAVSKLYRHILDEKDPEEIPALEEDLRVAFSRKPVKGHLFNRKGEDMINSSYPSHLGIPAGKVLKRKGGPVLVDSTVELHTRDGLMYFDSNRQPVRFGLQFADKRNSALPGQVSIKTPTPGPASGATLYKIQSHNNHLKEIKSDSYPPYRFPLAGEIRFTGSTLEIGIPAWDFSCHFDIEAQEARGESRLKEKLESEMLKSADYSFTVNSIRYPDGGTPDEDLFIPPSRIKKIRQELYRLLEEERKNQLQKRTETILKQLDEEWQIFCDKYPLELLPSRDKWGPVNTALPYLTAYGLSHQSAAPGSVGDNSFIPLSPLQFPGTEDAFRKAFESLKKDTAKGIFGLNNWGHIGLFKETQPFKQSPYILDAGLLAANRAGLLLLTGLLPGEYRGCYGWVESSPGDLPEGFSPAGNTSNLPLFISRNCFRKHSLNRSCKGCSRYETHSLTQNKKPYTVIIEDCMSWVFQGKNAEDSDSPSR